MYSRIHLFIISNKTKNWKQTNYVICTSICNRRRAKNSKQVGNGKYTVEPAVPIVASGWVDEKGDIKLRVSVLSKMWCHLLIFSCNSISPYLNSGGSIFSILPV